MIVYVLYGNGIILVLSILVKFHSAYAVNPLLEKYSANSQKVEPGSSAFKLIEEVAEEIFESPVGDILCEVFQTSASIEIGLGISKEKSKSIHQKCPQKVFSYEEQFYTQPKIFPRTYFLISDKNNTSSIHSWTTEMSETLIFVSSDLEKEELRSIIAHEIAVFTDAKMNMNLVEYLLFEYMDGLTAKRVPDRDMGTRVVTDAGNWLNRNFYRSKYFSASYAFATMRAFNFEAMAKKTALTSTYDQETCVRQFKYLFNFYENNKDLRPDSKSMQGFTAVLDSKENEPTDVEELFSELLKPSIQFKSRGQVVTYCQYMSIPFLSSASIWSFISNGPRPKVTGGW